MQEAINTYIKFVPFQEFNLWDVKNYTLELLRSDYPFIELNEILYLEKMEWVEIEKDKEAFENCMSSFQAVADSVHNQDTGFYNSVLGVFIFLSKLYCIFIH